MTEKKFFPVPVDSKWSYSSGFGPRKSPVPGASSSHKGIDIAVKNGTNIIAYSGGIVTKAGWQDPNDHNKGWGKYVEIKHDDGSVTRYAHLSNISVSVGDRIEGGEDVGSSGSTGGSSGNHLHFEYLPDGKTRINPKESLDSILKSSPSINFDPNSQGGGIENTSSDIALRSISNDLYSIHEKLFSTENIAFAAAQLAMGADIDDVSRYIVVNTIATSAVDASLKATLLREEFANRSLDGLDESYNEYMAKNPEFSSLKAGVTIFIATAVLTHGD